MQCDFIPLEKMKPILSIIFILGFNMATIAQIDFDNPPWGKNCENLTTQSEINICSYEKFLIADSILHTYYDSIVSNLNYQYLNQLECSAVTTDEVQKEYLKQLKEQKDFVITSQKDFEKFRISTTKIVEYQYKGGTLQPMVVNVYAFDLTVNQIKILINLMEEIMN